MRQPTPNDGAPQDAGDRKGFFRSMDGFLTLKTAIPRATADQIAYDMGVHGDTVRKWCREPGTDEESGTGRRSPLDRVCDLITAVHEVYPQGADLIVEHIRAHLEGLKTRQDRRPTEPKELEEKLQYAQMLITEISDDLRAQRREKLQAIK